MPESPVVDVAIPAARALATALTSLGDALARGDLFGVLNAEPILTTALAAVSSSRPRLTPASVQGEPGAALAVELEAAREALARCTALGRSLEEVVRAGTLGMGYDAAGGGVHARVRSAFTQSM